MNRGYFCFLLLCYLCFSFAEDCNIGIRNVTIINFPADGGVDVQEAQNIIFSSVNFGGGEIIDIDDGDQDLSDSEFRRERGLNILVDGTGKFLFPSLIDSNVHLFNTDNLMDTLAGISGFIDTGSDLDFLSRNLDNFDTFRSGPRLTSSELIASTSEGVVIQVTEEDDVSDQVELLASEGATALSIAFPVDEDILDEIIDQGSDEDIERIVVTALFEAEANLAGQRSTNNLEAYCLAVAPLDEMSVETLDLWSGSDNRAIISTLTVYQGSKGVENMKQFIARNGTLLFGSDNGAHVFFGPSSTSGIDLSELIMLNAVFDDIVETYRAATIVPAQFWGFTDVGVIEEGAKASFILTTEDPLLAIENLESNGTITFLRGEEVNCVDSSCNACDAPINNETAEDDTVEIVISVIVPLFFLLILVIMIIAGVLWHYQKRKPKHKRRKRRDFQMDLDDDDWDIPLMDSDNDFLEPGDEDDDYSEDSAI